MSDESPSVDPSEDHIAATIDGSVDGASDGGSDDPRRVSRRALMAGAGVTVLGVAIPGSPLGSVVSALVPDTTTTSSSTSTTSTTAPAAPASLHPETANPPYLGEIRMFAGNYAPAGWMRCDGSLVSVNDYQALYSLLGTTYGGNGVTNFALPNMQGNVAVVSGNGPGLTPRYPGSSGGEESVTLMTNQLPSHTHALTGSTAVATTNSPNWSSFATPGNGPATYGPATHLVAMAPTGYSGNSMPHENRMPSLAVTFIICVIGMYPNLT